MSAIAGVWRRRSDRAPDELRSLAVAMAGSLQRRGPASGDVWADGAAGFAMVYRHLAAFAGTAPADQPLVSSCGRFVLSSDGDIYNAGELIARLITGGRHVPGATYLEAITEGAAVWGVEATLQRIDGEIAGAIWDREQRRLHLFRDRLGAKPLYWTDTSDCFLFASELKALRDAGVVNPELDRGAVAAFLRSRAIPAPHTIYRGTQSLAPGTMLTMTAGGSPNVTAYWTLEQVVRQGLANPAELSDETSVQRFDTLMRKSVSRRIGKAPAGVLLSGGFDSALVAGIARDLGQGPVSTFTMGFRQKALNEAGFAADIARHIGSDHHSIDLDVGQARDVIAELPEIFDEPNADISQVPSLLLARLARKRVGVILTGDGASESFGGGMGNWKAAKLHGRIRALPLPLRHAAQAGIRLVPAGAWNALSKVLPAGRRPPHFGDKMHRLASVLTMEADELLQSFKSHWQDPNSIVIDGREPANLIGNPHTRSVIPNLFDRAHYFHTLMVMSDVVLTKGDRIASAAGVDMRFPFADLGMVEFGWSLPQNFKLRGQTSKWILRQATYRYVPPALLNRRKMTFDLPMGEWLCGPLRDWAEDLLDERRLRREGVFDPGPIRARWREHLRGYRNWQGPLWVILMFQAWKQRWLPG